MYKIYINEKPLILCKESERPEKPDDFLAINSESIDLNSLPAPETFAHKGWICITHEPEKSFERLKNQVIFIQAAGGLVRNEQGEYLFIFRKGKWDLPKGKIDPGESEHEAAIREVEEECGLQDIILKEKILNTYHIYTEKKSPILKQSAWYKMTALKQVLVPQLEEDITEALWLKKNELGPIKLNTYPSILDVLETVRL